MTSAADKADGMFLADILPKIRDVLDWYGQRVTRRGAGPKLNGFAGKFLAEMIEERALIPTALVSAPELLALTLRLCAGWPFTSLKFRE